MPIRAPIVNTFLLFYIGSYLFYEQGQQLNVSLSETVHTQCVQKWFAIKRTLFSRSLACFLVYGKRAVRVMALLLCCIYFG